VFPYNTYQGCIIKTPNKRFFPVQISSSLRRTSEPLPGNHEAINTNVKAVCIFRDHFMITVEKKAFHHPCLREYKIEHQSNQLLMNHGVEICKLRTGQDESPRFLVVKHHESIIAIVCNLNAKVEFVEIVPA
jgi:hypothetical protein